MHSPRLNFEAHPGASTRLGPFRSFISALLAGLLALTGLAAVAAPASAEDGIILAGTVTPPDGYELSDLAVVELVAVSDADDDWLDWLLLDFETGNFETGTFSFSELPSTDSYRIQVEVWGSAFPLSGWVGADGTVVRDIKDAAVFSSSRSDIDILPVLGETISGIISASDGSSIDYEDISLSMEIEDYPYALELDVDESGNFQFPGLWPDEQFRLYVRSYDFVEGTYDYVEGYVGADNKAGVNWDNAAIFTPGTGDINITLERGITLSGTVTVPDGFSFDHVYLDVSEFESKDYTATTATRYVVVDWVVEDGTFNSPPLPAGKQYVVLVSAYHDDPLIDEYLLAGYLGLDGELVKDLEDAKLFTATDHDVQIAVGFGQSPTDTVDPPKPPTKPVTPVKPKPVEGPKYTYVQVVPSPDLTGDGFGDLLAVDTSGVLWLFRGSATGNLNTPTKLGGGWAGLTISAPGDFNGDGKADILAKATNGDLFFYPGNGKGGFGAPTKAGWGWGPYEIIPAGDVTGDGIADVLAIDAKGVLYYYAGDGNGKFKGKLTQNGQGWANVDLYPAGDLNGDGNADILSIRKDGTLHTHLGRGDGGFRKSTQSGKGWAGYELFAGSDGNGDGLADLYSRNTKGELFFYAGKTGGFRTAVKVGTNW